MNSSTGRPSRRSAAHDEGVFAEQFPGGDAAKIADVMTRYYALNFIRKPEFMGFNGYNDGIKRTEFNPFAWGDQNETRLEAWTSLRDSEVVIAKTLPAAYADAFFELVAYPLEGSAAMNEKFLLTDRSFRDLVSNNSETVPRDAAGARAAYDDIQALTIKYNSLEDGKWDGMMSAAPRERHVFEMPRTAVGWDGSNAFPPTWRADVSNDWPHSPTPTSPFIEQQATVSINAARFARKSDTSTFSAKVGGFDPAAAKWNILADLGISGDSVVYGRPGVLAQLDLPWLASGQEPEPTAWLEYDFTTTTAGPATLALHLLPTFPVDSDHKLRYAVALDGGTPTERDMSGSGGTKAAGAGDGPSGADWPQNVLRNSAIDTIALGALAPGKHTLRLLYRDPGVAFEHLVITFPGAPPAYPVPPETK